MNRCGTPRRVLFMLGEHGLGKTTTMQAAVNARHGEPTVLDPDRHRGPNRATTISAPPCHGYGQPDNHGHLPVIEIYRLRFGRATPTEVRQADTDASTYILAGCAESETSCLVAHRAWNRTLPRWLSTAAECGWDVHAVMLRNPELAQRRRIRRYALRLALDTAFRRSFESLTSARSGLLGALGYDANSLRGMLIDRAVDSERRDLAETEQLYAMAEAAPGISTHAVRVEEGDDPGTVAQAMAAAAGLSDVLGPEAGGDAAPVADTSLSYFRDDPVAALPLGDAARDVLPDAPEKRDELTLHGLGMILDAYDDGLLPAGEENLAVLVDTYEALLVRVEASREGSRS